MSAAWRSKCPYNIADLDPCPKCDANNPKLAVGHVCEEPQCPTGRKPSLCWICGQPLPHDCIGSLTPVATQRGSIVIEPSAANVLIGTAHGRGKYEVQRANVADLLRCLASAYGLSMLTSRQAYTAQPTTPEEYDQLASEGAIERDYTALADIRSRVQSWLDKQGHDRCWYYPEIFNQIASALGLAARSPAGLPALAEFRAGCERYQAEEYKLAQALMVPNSVTQPVRLDGFALAPSARRTHGPPRNTELRARTPANTFARKWPIGTDEEHSHTYKVSHWSVRLRRARQYAGQTLDQLGARLTPPRTRKDISAMEHGRRGLSVELCAQLADALDCDRLWLAGWT